MLDIWREYHRHNYDNDNHDTNDSNDHHAMHFRTQQEIKAILTDLKQGR